MSFYHARPQVCTWPARDVQEVHPSRSRSVFRPGRIKHHESTDFCNQAQNY